MTEDVTLRLNLQTDSKTLERQIKSLSNKLQLEIDADLDPVKKQLKNLNTDTEIKVKTGKAQQAVEQLKKAFERVGKTQQKVKQESERSARERIKSLQEQTREVNKFAKATKNAQRTLNRKTADLGVARARIGLLEDQINKTRILVSQGRRSQEALDVKEATLRKQKQRVADLDREVKVLQLRTQLQGRATQAVEQNNKALKKTKDRLEDIREAAKQSEDAGSNLLEMFAGFSIVDNIIDRVVDAILELPGAALAATLELQKLEKQLDFGTGGQGAAQLDKLFEQSQRLGVSFTQLSTGYAQFAAAVRGTELESDTDQIFEGIARGAATLQLGAEETERAFLAISQIAAKGVVSQEELRGQLAEALPGAVQLFQQGLQNLVDKGIIPLTEINPTLVSASKEQQAAYKVTIQDLNKMAESGKFLAKDILPEVAQLMQDSFEPPKDSLQQAISRAQNAVIKLAASIGEQAAPTLQAVLNRVVELFDYIQQNGGELVNAFQPFVAGAKLVIGTLATLDEGFKALFGQGGLETLISLLDEIAIALLLTFGAPLIGIITGAVAALAPMLSTLALVTTAVIAAVKGFELLVKAIDAITGGKASALIDAIAGSAMKAAGALKEMNDEVERTKQFGAAATGLEDLGKAAGKLANEREGFAKFTLALVDLEQTLKAIDLTESIDLAEIEESLAEGTIQASEAARQRTETAIEANKARLENAVAQYNNAVAGLEAGVQGGARDALIKARDEAEKEIPKLRKAIAKETIAIREAVIKSELDPVRHDLEQALKAIDLSESIDLANIEKSLAEGTIQAAEAARQRIETSIEANKARLENAVAQYNNAVAGLETGVQGGVRDDLIKARDEAEKEIPRLQAAIAKETLAIREATIKDELDRVRHDLEQTLKAIDLTESIDLAEIEASLAEGTIQAAEAARQRTETAIEANKARLENAIAQYNNAVAGLETGVQGDARDDLIKARDEAEREIPKLQAAIAKETIAIREATIKAELDLVRQSGDKLAEETARAEQQRISKLRELAELGNVNIEAANEERIALTEERIAKEIALESERIATLESLRDDVPEGSEQDIVLLEQIIAAEQKRSELIGQQAALEQERQESLARQVEAQTALLDTQVRQLGIQAQLASIGQETAQLQQELSQAQFEAESARLSLVESLAQIELDRINDQITAQELLLQLDEERRDEVAQRLGLDPGKNEIELLRERQAREEEIWQTQLKQLETQQKAEQQQIEFQRGQIRFEIEQERFRLRAAEIEAQIARLKAQQVVSAAQAARSAALAAGDTEAAAQAELEILQARQQLGLIDSQLDLINEQNNTLHEREQVQNEILDVQEQTLEASQEQARAELEANQTASERQGNLQTEQALLAANLKQRNGIRDAALTALQYGTEEQQLSAEILEARSQLADIEAQYARQREIVADLEATGANNADEELVLANARAELHQTSLQLLQSEFELESRLANDVAREREQALQRQVRILEQRRSIIEAEGSLAQAQSALATEQLRGSLVGIDRDAALGNITESEATDQRAAIELQILDEERQALEAQQEADRKRLEVEQQIEIMRLQASKAEAQVTAARAETVRAEAQLQATKAAESGDEETIAVANAAVQAADAGIQAARKQVAVIDEQIKQTQELQDIQRQTQQTEQEAAQERLNNRERELQLAREIAQQGINSGFRVSGGGVSAGKTYTVGEQGAELFKGADGSTKMLGLAGQQLFTPPVPGTIIPNHQLQQTLQASVMRSDADLIKAIKRGFQTSGSDFARLAGVLANRTAKPVTINQYQANDNGFDAMGARLSRL